VLVVLLALENYFLFIPSRADQFWGAPPAMLNVEDVELTGPDRTRIHAWWAAPRGWTPEQGAVLFCHGNAGNLSNRGMGLVDWQKGLGSAVLIFDYPGYGRSTGQPTEAGCYASADLCWTWLTETKGIPPEQVILYGESLGGAVAIDLGSRQPCRAVVTRAAFSSFPDMAQKAFPWLPARWLCRNQMDNVGKICKVSAPVVIAHGTEDELVPYSQAERLFAAAGEPKLYIPLQRADHNTSPGPEFYRSVREFLNEHPVAGRK
jgi:alpha-beta hydrolase superfamily lysophospholipase